MIGDSVSVSDLACVLPSVADSLVQSGLTNGVQVAAAILDGDVEVASAGVDGFGLPIDDCSISAWFCTTKLLTAATTLCLADSGDISLSECLGDRAHDAVPPPARNTTVWDALTFQSGFWGDAAEGYMVCDRAQRADAYSMLSPRFRRPFRGVYGEYVAYDILGWWLAAVTEESLSSLVRTCVSAPAGAWDQVHVAEPVDGTLLRVSSGASASAMTLPYAAEVVPAAIEAGSAANGAYASASAMAKVGAWACHEACRSHGALAALIARCTRPGRDPVLGRECAFTAGLWHDLTEHQFSEAVVSRTSCGLAGLGGAATVVLDPARRIVVSWRDFTVHTDLATILEIRRRITSALAL